MIEVDEKGVRVVEEIGGSRGTDYWHIEINGMLEPIRWKFRRYRRLTGSSKTERKRTYEYRIPIEELRKIGNIARFYEFSYSNAGYGPYLTIYEVDCKNLSIRKVSGANLNYLNFKIYSHDVEERIRTYQKYVPAFIEKVKSVQGKFKFNISFEKAARLEDIYNDPNNAYKVALTFSESKARARALETYIQSTHELYVLALVIKALEGKILSSYDFPTLYIEKGGDYPSAIIESDGRKFTLWFQFSIRRWIDVVFKGLLKLFKKSDIASLLQEKAVKKEFEIFERLFNVRPKNVQEAYELIRKVEKLRQRQYVMPDIVVFEGEYQEREDIKRSPPKKALIIDAKIKIKEDDVKQLLAYKEIFDKTLGDCKIEYIVACLGRVSLSYKQTLEANEIEVIQNVAPEKEGEKALIKEVKDFFKIL